MTTANEWPDRYESVYVFHDREQAFCKIGFSIEPLSRIGSIQAHHPRKLDLRYSAKTSYARLVEKIAHKMLAECRVHGEWFRCDAADAVLAVKLAKRIAEDAFGHADCILSDRGIVYLLKAEIVLRDHDDDPLIVELVTELKRLLWIEHAEGVSRSTYFRRKRLGELKHKHGT